MDRSIYLIGLNHCSAELAVRECFALPDNERLPEWGLVSDEAVSEMMTLSTCNRVEILAVGKAEDIPQRITRHWAARCSQEAEALAPHVYVHKDQKAVRHVFTVAAGLDSLVLGEPQILGQLKTAYKKAVEDNTAKVILNRLMHKAFMTAKRVRTETGVASSAVSVSYAAVELAKRIFGDLRDKKVLLIGAGKMGELAATHLCSGQGAKIAVTNRTFARAEALAERFQGEALPFDELEQHLAAVDIVISSTGAAEPVISAQTMRAVMRRRKNKPVFLIDIAVPRDVEPDVNKLDNVYLYNIDDLGAVVESNRAARKEEAVKAGLIVAEEAERFQTWLHSLYLQPTIADLVQRSERIAKTELDRTLRRIGPVTPEVESALESMLTAVVKKLNHDPISFLQRRVAEKEAGPRYLDVARRLFNLDDDKAPNDAHKDRKNLE